MPAARRATMLGVLAACSLASAPVSPPPEAFEPGLFRPRIEKLLAAGTAPSMSVAVTRGGRIVWSEAFGLADREARVPATTSTPYSVASVSKPFTATAVMLLAERGQLSLDAPLDRYVGSLSRPGLAAPSSEVTVRRLLGHVAGFPVHYQYFFDDRPDRPLPFADLMRCYGPEIHEPGGRYTYSNLGYAALGETVARVSGQQFGRFLAAEIFSPLGLTRTSVPERAEDAAGAARRYGRDGRPLPFFVTDTPGASALFATAEDLVRFGSFHAGAPMEGQRPVLTAASLAAMRTAGAGDYGLGWSVNANWHGHVVLWHSGAMPGVSATLWLLPAERIAIAVVANQIGAPVNQLAGEILASLVPISEPASEPRTSGEATRAPVRPGTKSLLTDAPVGTYRGRLLTCPTPEPLVIDVRGPAEIGVILGSAGVQTLRSASGGDGTLVGTLRGDGPRAPDYELDLDLAGDRLEGPVTRRTGLGPRANELVTVWAALQKERRP